VLAITEVEFFGLRSTLPKPARFAWGTAEHRNVGLLRVRTEDGSEGWGETSVTFPIWSLEERALTVRHGLAPQVVGHDALDAPRLLDELLGTFGRLAALWSPVAIHGSLGALQMALLDLRGRLEGRSAAELLLDESPGHPSREVELYAVGFGGTPAETAAAAARATADGYRSVKIRAGFGERVDADTVRATRAAVGDAGVLVDANMSLGRAEAARLAQVAEAEGVGWLEEPLARDDVAGLADLRSGTSVPIAAGENAYTRTEGLRLVEDNAVDVVMPDLGRCGGYAVARDVIHAAVAADGSYSPHHYASDLGFAAALHLCAVEPGGRGLLRDVSDWPLRSAILRDPPAIDGGSARVPTGPGLGVEIDPAALDAHRVA